MSKRNVNGRGYKEKQMTSQIVSLPGCVKRDKYRIKDDHKFINKTNQGHVFKIERDYKSNIPGLV